MNLTYAQQRFPKFECELNGSADKAELLKLYMMSMFIHIMLKGVEGLTSCCPINAKVDELLINQKMSFACCWASRCLPHCLLSNQKPCGSAVSHSCLLIFPVCPIFALFLALFWSPPTPEDNILPFSTWIHTYAHLLVSDFARGLFCGWQEIYMSVYQIISCSEQSCCFI